MDKPIPWSSLIVAFDAKSMLIFPSWVNSTLWVLAKSCRKTGNICCLLFENGINDRWPSKMNKSLASRPYYSIKEVTNFPFNKISDIFLMKRDVILENLSQNNTEGTLILKSICHSSFFIFISCFEVCVGAGSCHLFHSNIDFLKFMNPLWIFWEFLNLLKKFLAGIRCGGQEKGFLNL